MTADENVAAQLACLLERRSLGWSRCSGTFLRAIGPLLHAGVIVEERSGAGRRLVVRDEAALLEFSQRRFPNTPLSDETLSRIAGVARFRNSKAYASDTPEIVSVRTWRADALTRCGQNIDADRATAEHGVFSFALAEGGHYALSGICALVENPALFALFERLRLPASLVVYGRGRCSTRLLDWLAGMTAPDFALLHLPDYDPVGLSEFERLRQRLGERVRLHVPADIADRFARFSKPALLDRPNSRAMLATLRSLADPQIRTIVALIDRHNAGLEQEALLVEY